MKAIHTAPVAAGSGVTTDDQQHPLSCNSHKHQNKINAQATEIATMWSELYHALDESWKLREMFNPDWLVEAMMKEVTNMTVKGSPKTSQGTQYHGNSNYIDRLRQPSWHKVLMGHLT